MEIQTQPESSLAVLSLSAIDFSDQALRITTDMETGALEHSISQVGMLNPPRLIRTPSSWRIVSGFRRLAACAALGIAELEAWCLAPETGEAACALLAIADNALNRPLCLIEQVRASRLLVHHFGGAADLESLARGVGLPPNLNLLKQLASLCKAPAVLTDAMALEAISLPMALDLMGRPEADGVAVATVFSELRPSLNRQRELLGLLDDIARRDDLPVAQVLAEATGPMAAGGDAAEQPIDRSVRFAHLRSTLRTRRYPHLAEAEIKRARQLKRLKLGATMQLVPPANFEGRRFELKLSFCTLAELRSHHDTCAQLLQNPTLADLLA
jgi:ParB family chromosome partitioning protein